MSVVKVPTTAEVQLVFRTQTVLAFFFALLQKNFNTATPASELGVAVYDCLRAGVSPSVLVGREEFGSPTLYRVRRVVKLVRREVGELVQDSLTRRY